MDHRRKHNRNDEPCSDYPTYSRLFIVGDKRASEDQYREAFSKFGTIEDMKIPRDHNTGEPKGIAFIKFSKTSEAAAALEEMNQKPLPNRNRIMKVMVAANRNDIQTDDDDSDKYKRIFITVPKSMDEKAIQDVFMAFGNVDQVRLQLDRNTEQSKGFAYVKYRKFSEAARATEECDPKYRAIFAQPRGPNRRQETSYESNINNLAESTSNMRHSLISAMNVQPQGFTRVDFMCSPYLTQMHVAKVFDIVPGMIDCKYMVDMIGNFGKGTVEYSNPFSATYAIEKLHRFEYPPGAKIFVKPNNSRFHPHERNFSNIPNVVKNLKNAISSTSHSSSPDLAQLADAIAEASKLIKKATGVTDEDIPDSTDLNYCSVKLPPPQPLADIDSPVEKRCFLVCKPQPPPLTVLRDVFCRFGNLINVYTLPGKTVGFARYTSIASAENAIQVLHGAEICGVRMKVLEADDEAPPKKRKSNYD